MAPKTILFAEDDLGNFILTKRYMRRWGIQSRVVRFTDGQEILDFLFSANFPYDPHDCMVILDVHMPRIDGINVLKRIRMSSHLDNMPVMMLSTTDRADTIERCMQLGASHFFVKPLEQQPFLQAIEDISQNIDELDDSGISHQPVTC